MAVWSARSRPRTGSDDAECCRGAALSESAREAPQTPEALGDVVNLTSWRRELVVQRSGIS